MNSQAIDDVRLDGGVLCLDFVNTIPDRYDGTNRDLLGDFHDLIYWAKKAKAIDEAGYKSFQKAMTKSKLHSTEFLSETKKLRDLIYSIFHPISHQQKVKPRDLAEFNKISSRYFPLLEVVMGTNGYSEQWNIESNHFQLITAPIVKSARELLLSDKLLKVKECSNCGWLFLDTTKNGKRRWCSMEDCGSKMKALEWYYRKKGEK